MLENLSYKHTYKIRGAYCFSTATIVTSMRLNVTLYKATNIHREYVMLIASTLHQLLQARALILRYLYIACLVTSYHLRLSICRYMSGKSMQPEIVINYISTLQRFWKR